MVREAVGQRGVSPVAQRTRLCGSRGQGLPGGGGGVSTEERSGCERGRAPGRAGVALTHGLCLSLRGGMIQTAEQYQFLHRALALYAAQLPGEPSP